MKTGKQTDRNVAVRCSGVLGVESGVLFSIQLCMNGVVYARAHGFCLSCLIQFVYGPSRKY